MSLLDQVRELEGQLVERLKNLEPLVGEYNQLRKLAQRLGVSYTPADGDARTTAAPARRKAAASKRAPAKRSARTARRTPTKRAAKDASPTPAAGATAPPSARTGTAAKAAPTARTPATTGARRRRGRKAASARPGQRRDDVLRVVTEHPGISVREIGEQLGVDATGLYRVANKLTADGRLRKDGTALYAIASGAAAQPDRTAQPAAAALTDAGASPSDADARTAASTDSQADQTTST